MTFQRGDKFMTKIGQILAIIVTLLGQGCGALESDNYHPVVDTKQGMHVTATGDALAQNDEMGLKYIENFAKDAEAYVEDLRRDLATVNDDNVQRCEFFSAPNEFFEGVSVVIDAQGDINARALYWYPNFIILTNDYAMESLLGHELVRAILFYCGHKEEALQSSSEWTGLIGEMWNIAETDSLKYIDNEVPK